MTDNILDIAHIHLDSALFRVHVLDSSVFNIEDMNDPDGKPEFVLWVSRSADPEQNKQSILVNVVDGYDLNELAEWIKSYESPLPTPPKQ